MPLPADFQAHLQRVDPDRWLAARFVAEPDRRDELLALYALNDELARVAESVREPMIGEMRLAWWREALDAVCEGRGPRGHPVLEALAAALTTGRLPREPLDRMIDTRSADLEREPFGDEAALTAYLDGTAGAVMWAAAVLLDPGARPEHVEAAGRAWGWAGVWRAGGAWAARGRRWRPQNWADDMTPEALAAVVRTRVEEALDGARLELQRLPVAAFPAVAYAGLARDHVRGRRPGDLAKRLKLLRATLTGRL